MADAGRGKVDWSSWMGKPTDDLCETCFVRMVLTTAGAHVSWPNYMTWLRKANSDCTCEEEVVG